jgi:hypothetical protein
MKTDVHEECKRREAGDKEVMDDELPHIFIYFTMHLKSAVNTYSN